MTIRHSSFIRAALLAGLTMAFGPTAAAAQQVPVDPIYIQQTTTIIGVNHVGMTINDLDSSVEFYQGAMGLKRHGSSKKLGPALRGAGLVKDIRVQTVTLKGPNSFLRLMEFEHSVSAHKNGVLPAYGPGITHICFQAPKVKPLDGKAAARGATWVSSTNAMVDMRGVGFMYGYMRDPSGLIFEIEHAPEPKIDIDVWMGHVAMATNDLTKTLEFYSEVVGIKPYRRVDNLAGPTFDQVAGVEGGKLHGAWFRIAPYYNLEFWEYVSPRTGKTDGQTPLNRIGYSLVALETSDIEADYERLTAAGIALEAGIVSVDEGRAIFLRDPDGNLLSITEYEAGSNMSLDALNVKYSGEK